MASVELQEAKNMIETLLTQHDFTEESLAKALSVYPKTVREIRMLTKKRLSRKTKLALIGLYCQTAGALS